MQSHLVARLGVMHMPRDKSRHNTQPEGKGGKTMKHYKIKYANGGYKIVSANTSLEVIKKYDLATREHIDTRVIELSGEQEAIANSNAI